MSKLVEKIAEAMAASGAVSFARFMELALYCPVYGYYEKEEDTIGRRGDYFTNPSVGPLFGELLACQFSEWLGQPEAKGQSPNTADPESEPAAGALQLVEAGAHRGELARDILSWMRQQRLELFQRLEYCIVEPSDRRRQWQQQTLAGFPDKVHWTKTLAELASRLSLLSTPASSPIALRRIIFSNELLDALPVHRLGWDATRRSWFEWGVTLQNARFAWTRLPDQVSRITNHASLPTLNAQVSTLLPNGFTLEICPAAEEWWREATAVLGCGRLVTIDYGSTSEQLLVPERKEGTLRAYRRHRVSSEVLADPGEQDITAQVNFSAIQGAGEAAGLKTESFLSQEQFLTRIAARIWNRETAFGEWTSDRTRQFQTLTHPEHLGRAFRVLVQSRE